MYLIPLNQLESVELVIHALKVAGGEADCSTCPARKVCMKQCLTIAAAIENMIGTETLPHLDADQQPENDPPAPQASEPPKTSHLKRIK
ncbi:MAG: hypothetical protein C0616_03810 [Desulfuromonas sp.]|nr:MAG: hypothetical protein C0616_03810 [Desulfuromonas sp.]